jgi:cytochrome c553
MSTRGVFRWGARIVGGGTLLVALGAGSFYGVSERRGHRRFDVPDHPIVVEATPAAVARGEHVATIRGCNDCHAFTMGGRTIIDDPAIGRLTSTNLTNGRPGGPLSDRDWERAVRHGVRRDSTPLALMPAHEYTGISDEDLAAIIAWTRSLPPVDADLAPTRIGPLARALHTAGEFVLYPAEHVPHAAPHPVRVDPAPDARYGAYLATGCKGCHGPNYSGGKIAGAPPDWLPAANLTPAGLDGYTEERFMRTLRTGVRPNGTPLRPPMASKAWSELTDVELRALWAFLRTLPPAATGDR